MHILETVLFVLFLLVGNHLCTPLEGSVEANSADDETAASIVEDRRATCTRYSGSESTYDDMLKAVRKAPVCFLDNIPDLIEVYEAWQNLTFSSRVGFFSKYCPIARSTLLECARPVEELSIQCLRPGGHRVEGPDFPVHLFPAMLDVLCENSGEIIFVNSSGKPSPCVTKFWTIQNECLHPASKKVLLKVKENYSEADCRTLETARACVASRLESCGHPKFVRVFDVPYNELIKETVCKDFVTLTET